MSLSCFEESKIIEQFQVRGLRERVLAKRQERARRQHQY